MRVGVRVRQGLDRMVIHNSLSEPTSQLPRGREFAFRSYLPLFCTNLLLSSDSALPEEVWELVDRSGEGKLDRDELVVGMWLIDQGLKGRKCSKRRTMLFASRINNKTCKRRSRLPRVGVNHEPPDC